MGVLLYGQAVVAKLRRSAGKLNHRGSPHKHLT
jgi:hypothetical protein